MSAKIKAVVLAAGKGTRMKHLTQERPKPMLEVHGKPVLELIVTALRDAGVEEICIITGYKAEAIHQFFRDGARWRLRISYATQLVQDGTGKAPELAKQFVGDDPFFLVYGDILTEPANYRGMLETFGGLGGCDGVLTVRQGEDVSKGAAVLLADDFTVLDVIEKPPPGSVISPWYNAGIYIFTPRLYEYTARLEKSPRGEYELPDAIRQMIRHGLKIKAFELAGYWLDVRDPEALARAHTLISS